LNSHKKAQNTQNHFVYLVPFCGYSIVSLLGKVVLSVPMWYCPAVLRHSALVRVTHWINALAFVGLVASGIAILLAHPRLYWGETGTLGAPSLIDLPLPFVFGQSGWGRYLHFLSAWACVLAGVPYVVSLVSTRHLSTTYSPLQRFAYRGVVFILFPLMIWTGFAMSPAITSVIPPVVIILGGQQSARTIHFVVANLLVLFLIVHIAMVSVTGFTTHMRAMITGHS
jgi:thiosulfate reductase cytochrome b subunit